MRAELFFRAFIRMASSVPWYAEHQGAECMGTHTTQQWGTDAGARKLDQRRAGCSILLCFIIGQVHHEQLLHWLCKKFLYAAAAERPQVQDKCLLARRARPLGASIVTAYVVVGAAYASKRRLR